MKLVFYKDSEIVNVMENLTNVVVEDNNVYWDDGSLQGINVDFLLLDDVEITTLNDVIPHDRKAEFQKVNELELLRKENEQLKVDNEMNAIAIMELTNIVLNKGVE